MVFVLAVLLVSFLVGSIPSGYAFAKFLFGVDVTRHGSGNIGATNVARVLGSTKYFFFIFAIDFSKAFLLLKLIVLLGGGASELFLSATLLLVGNGHSLFLSFKGGKGVATALGILAALFPYLFLSFLFSWSVVLFFTRRVGMASLAATLSILPAEFLFLRSFDTLTVSFLLFMVIWIFVRHRSNLSQMFK